MLDCYFLCPGDYPIAAVFTSEFSSPSRRGAMVSAVFAMQGLGVLMASLVSLVLLAMFKSMIISDVMNIDYVWRLCVVSLSRFAPRNAQFADVLILLYFESHNIPGIGSSSDCGRGLFPPLHAGNSTFLCSSTGKCLSSSQRRAKSGQCGGHS